MQQSSPYSECWDNHVLICNRISFDVVFGDIATSTEDTVIDSRDDDVNLRVPTVEQALRHAFRQAFKMAFTLGTGTVKETDPDWSGTPYQQGLKKVFIKCLEKSALRGHQSVATPAIGMGVIGYPADVVASSLLEGVAEYAEKNPESSIKQVKLYLYEREITTAEKEIFRATMRLLGGMKTTNGHCLTNNAMLEVFTGDLADTKADVIVNTTSTSMALSGGAVSSALLNKAGKALQDEFKNLASVRDTGVVITKGYALPCAHVVHAALPSWQDECSEKKLYEIISNCLQVAEKLNATSVAFPAVGTGDQGYPPERVARILFNACAEFSHNNSRSSLKTLKVVIYTNDVITKAGFENALGRKLKGYYHPPAPYLGRTGPTNILIEGTQRSMMSSQLGKTTANGNELKNGVILEVFVGDLVNTEADVIVNSAGIHLSLSNGYVAPALLKGAGKSLQDECNTLSPINVGEVAVTKGYGLLCTHVAHACTPSWRNEETEKELKALIMKCLEAADYRRAISVAFPALGTGMLGYPPAAVARAFIQASAAFSICDSRRSLKIIKVVILTGNASVKAGFDKELGRTLKPYVYPIVSRPRRNEKLLEDLPNTWRQPLQKYGDFVVTGKKELADCISCFKSTLSATKDWKVIEVTRVQNPDSYQLYNHWRLSVARKLDKQEHEVEKILWHGTTEESVEKIKRSKFDRGFAGIKAGTGYGHGSYFSTTSEYSVRFCDANNNGERFIIMARVISGEYTKGSSTLKSAPYKGESKQELYDSVVDNESNPQMFVVFHDASAYPEYVIKFKL